MRILIIDAYNMLHRARVVRNLGPRGIVFNFLRMLRSAVDSVRPDVAYFVVEGDPQWRKALLGEYNPYYLHGYLSRLLFQPTAELERDIDTLWRTQVGGRKVCPDPT